MRALSILKNKLCGPDPRLNIVKTIVFNYKLLPFKQFIKIPIFIYGKWNFRSLKGRVVIDSERIRTGMLMFGYDTAGYFTSAISTFSILNNAEFHISEGCRIGQGVQICIYPNASLVLKERASLNDNVKVICSKKIIIGYHTNITWECQVMDYNSHYILDISSNKIATVSKPVVLGDYCWICNRSTIMPGTILPNRIIVTSGSLLNRDYVKLGIKEKSLMGGSPAKIIKEGVFRLYKNENFEKVQRFFDQNPSASFYEVTSDDCFEE